LGTSGLLVLFKVFGIWPKIKVWKSLGEQSRATQRRNTPMHDFLIALAFIGMVVAPAIVVAKAAPVESKQQ
jgi:hypothetical protein